MIKLRLIQCIWTIWLVLVSAIGFFIVSPMPAKATDLCGQPPALAELLIGSYLQKGYVSTQVKVIEGNVTNSFLISGRRSAAVKKREDKGGKKEAAAHGPGPTATGKDATRDAGAAREGRSPSRRARVHQEASAGLSHREAWFVVLCELGRLAPRTAAPMG